MGEIAEYIESLILALASQMVAFFLELGIGFLNKCQLSEKRLRFSFFPGLILIIILNQITFAQYES